MPCLCKQALVMLGQSMVSVPVPPGFQLGLALPGLNITLPKLAIQLGALTAAAQAARSASSLSLAATLPSLPMPAISLDAALAAKLGGLASGVQAIQTGLGVDLSASAALPQLQMLASSIQVNGSLLNALLDALMPLINTLLDLLPVCSAVLSARALGINLLGPSASLQLGSLASQASALSINLAASLPALSSPQFALRLALVAMIEQSAALGINLMAPGGALSLQATLNLFAGLPPLPSALINFPALPPLKLALLAALAQAIQAIRAATGINPLLPGGLSQITASLMPLLSLQLPALPFPALPPINLALAAKAAAITPQMVSSLNLSAVLPSLQLPTLNLGSLPALAIALKLTAGSFGVTLPCTGASCAEFASA
jgi:hypothetical protein